MTKTSVIPIRCPPLSPISWHAATPESLKTRFLTRILSKYLLIQFPHSLTAAAADNFIRQLKFYRGNVITLCVSEIISDWKCWLHFSSSSVSQISAWHRDIMTPVSRLMLVSSPLIAADNGSALHRLIITRLKPTHADNKMERAPDSHDQSMETFCNTDIFGFCLSEWAATDL